MARLRRPSRSPDRHLRPDILCPECIDPRCPRAETHGTFGYEAWTTAFLRRSGARTLLWRLLLADHAPLIASMLFKSFVEPNVRTLSQPDLESQLDDHLHSLRAELGEGAFPRTAKQYLEDWAADERGWLRK